MIWLAALLALATPSAALRADEPTAAPASDENSVVVLKSGQTFTGRVTRDGRIYRVALAYGEIRLKVEEVDLICRDMLDGYQQKRAQMHVASVQDHLTLAQWCQRQRLFEQAKQELDAARSIDPEDPRIALLDNRLSLLTNPPKIDESAVPPTPRSFDDLDQLVRTAPPGAVEMFTQAVQPTLDRNCTAAGCHGPQSASSFRLQRLPPGQSANHRLTQRNLQSVLPYINAQDIDESPLLKKALAPHGGAKTAPLSSYQVAPYAHMREWAYQMAGSAPQSLAAEAAAGAQPTLVRTWPTSSVIAANYAEPAGPAAGSPSADRNAAAASTNVVPTSAEAPLAQQVKPNISSAPRPENPQIGVGAAEPSAAAQNWPQASRSADDEAYAAQVEQLRRALQTGRPNVQRGAPVDGFTPRDPFDPEIFNRRYFPPASGVGSLKLPPKSSP